MSPAAWLTDLADFCYPGVCICARRACVGEALCPTCNDALDDLCKRPSCEACALPLATHGAPCPRCRGKGFRPFSRIARLGVYGEPLQHLIRQIKFHRDWPAGEFLARRLCGQDLARRVLADAELLVPVPLHPLRQIARGYNQAHVLARCIGRQYGIAIASPLARTRHTAPQTSLASKTHRASNVRGAFTLVEPKTVAGKRVVIVDDVLTSGATLRSAGRAMMSSQVASLDALVLAVADPRGRGFERI